MNSPFSDLLLHLRRSWLSLAVIVIIALTAACFLFSRPYFSRALPAAESRMLDQQALAVLLNICQSAHPSEQFRKAAVTAKN